MASEKAKKAFLKSIEGLKNSSQSMTETDIRKEINTKLTNFSIADDGIKGASMVSLLGRMLSVSLIRPLMVGSKPLTFNEVFTGTMPEKVKGVFELKMKNNRVAQLLVQEIAERLLAPGSGKNFYYTREQRSDAAAGSDTATRRAVERKPTTMEQREAYVARELQRERQSEAWLDRRALERDDHTGTLMTLAQTKAANAAGRAEKRARLAAAHLVNTKVAQKDIDASLRQADHFNKAADSIAEQEAAVLSGNASTVWGDGCDDSPEPSAPPAPSCQSI